MPTGIAIQHAREQLFDAAERVLRRDGASALTSRAVTAEAGCAKGVLHRHFADFDAFLAELVGHRVARIAEQATVLYRASGTGTVADNIAEALRTLFESVAVGIIALITSRDHLRERLRAVTPHGVPVLHEATAMLASYLRMERELGRIAADADVETMAPMLIGTGHLLFAGRTGELSEADAVDTMVRAVLAGTG